jgi:hypothetical protein
MMSGELGKTSLEEWSQKSTEDIVKAFEEVKKVVLSPPAVVVQ